MQKEMPATVKMLMGSVAMRSTMHPSKKRPVSSFKAKIPPVVKQPRALSWIRMARADWATRRVDWKLMAYKRDPLLAPHGHMSDKFPWQMRPQGRGFKTLFKKRRTRLSPDSKTNWAIQLPISVPFLTPMPSCCTGKRA
jgi:hypothetical protein